MCAVHRPRPLTATSSAITSSSPARPGARARARREITCSASERRKPTFARDSPAAARSSSGSSARISSGVGGRSAEARGQAPVDRARGEHRQLLADDRAHERAVVVVAVGTSLARVRQRAAARSAAASAEVAAPCARPGAPAPARRPRSPRRREPAASPRRALPALSAGSAARTPTRLAVERVQRALQRHRDAGEARRVAHRVARGLGRAQALHEIEERADVVGVERDHELLVVEPERVGRVVVDARVFAPDLRCAPA